MAKPLIYRPPISVFGRQLLPEEEPLARALPFDQRSANNLSAHRREDGACFQDFYAAFPSSSYGLGPKAM